MQPRAQTGSVSKGAESARLNRAGTGQGGVLAPLRPWRSKDAPAPCEPDQCEISPPPDERSIRVSSTKAYGPWG
jgi:hypothetical protein